MYIAGNYIDLKFRKEHFASSINGWGFSSFIMKITYLNDNIQGYLPQDSVCVYTVHKYILLSSHVNLHSDELHNIYNNGLKLLFMHFKDVLSSLNEKLVNVAITEMFGIADQLLSATSHIKYFGFIIIIYLPAES